MADWYFALKFIHVVSSAVLFGTGLGVAFITGSLAAGPRSAGPRSSGVLAIFAPI